MKPDIDKLITEATDILNKKKYHNTAFDYIYPFTTENINGYLSTFDLNNKNLLTVGSSADQALNAILKGCKDITLYDICPFTKEYFNLKKAAILTLKSNEYLDFFNTRYLFTKSKSFKKEIYILLRNELVNIDKDSLKFWDILFTNFSKKEISTNLFSNDNHSKKTLKHINTYLINEDNYNILRNNLTNANIEFICDDIFNYNIDKEYDNIWLSNIVKNYSINDIIALFNGIINYLKDNGMLLFAYLYDTSADYGYIEGEPDIYDLLKVFEALPKEIKQYNFKGINGVNIKSNHIKDSIITYKKLKKM